MKLFFFILNSLIFTIFCAKHITNASQSKMSS